METAAVNAVEVTVQGTRLKLGTAVLVTTDGKDEKTGGEQTIPEPIVIKMDPSKELEATGMENEEKELKSSVCQRRSLRKRCHPEEPETKICPVCGMTLKKTSLQNHMEAELERLDKVTSHAPKSSDLSSSGKKKSRRKPTPSGSEERTTHHQRFQTYLRVRYAREKRKAAEKQQLTNCPVCNRSISGTDEELSQHVNKCLNGEAMLEDEVDIEGEFDEYTWAGQTRIRATSMLPGGGLSDLGNTAVRKPSDEDTESDLDVDGDTADQFGDGQYDESDLLVIADEEAEENSSVIREILLEGSSRTRTVSDRSNPDPPGLPDAGPSGSSSPRKAGEESSSVIASLKARINELTTCTEQQVHCLICMDPYKRPLVSVQCWHVYCEDCWLRTLGAKKLCPQCNMITSPADLRRVYL